LLKDLLRHYREERGLTQEELAALVQPPVSPETISNLERGRTRPYRHTLEALCDALRLDKESRQAVWTARGASRPIRVTTSTGPHSARGSANADEPTRLIGREPELHQIERRLLQPSVRLLTLVGPGGVGKTRLAVSLMQRAAEHFDNGSAFVDLSALRQAELVVPTIARAMNVPESGDQPMLHRLASALHPLNVLLVLDNLEHLLDAAAELGELLATCPRVKMLATSREPLRMRWENLYVVPSLGLPILKDLATPESVRAAPAVELFIERAESADEKFAVTTANAQVIASLCRRLDGLPLALELAAARVRSLSPEVLLEHLDEQLDLVTGARDAPARQQSLRATLNWSYALLGRTEQALLRSLGVFAGWSSLQAIEAISSEAFGLVLTNLVALVDKNLVRQRLRANHTFEYRLLESVRAYALEQLHASGEYEATASRHASYYLKLAETAAAHLEGPLQLTWLDCLEEEHDNLRAALAWSLDGQSEPEMVLRLAGALYWFWWSRGHVTEGREWLRRALTREAQLSTRSVRAPKLARLRALKASGVLARQQSDYTDADTFFASSLALAQELDDRNEIADSLYWRGSTLLWLGDEQRAHAFAEESLAIWRQLRNRRGMCKPLATLANLAVADGDYARATALHEERLRCARDAGDRLQVARVECYLGMLAGEQGQHDRATQLLEGSVRTFEELDHAEGMAWALAKLARIACARGEAARAKQQFGDSLTLFQKLGAAWGVAECILGLASLAGGESQFEVAVQLCGSTAALRERHGLQLGDNHALERATAGLHAVEQSLAIAHAALGATRFDELWRSGRAMSVDDAVTLAIGTVASGD
jgi:predicted ATPase/DNA-binding XRE family transcriptional regulator